MFLETRHSEFWNPYSFEYFSELVKAFRAEKSEVIKIKSPGFRDYLVDAFRLIFLLLRLAESLRSLFVSFR